MAAPSQKLTTQNTAVSLGLSVDLEHKEQHPTDAQQQSNANQRLQAKLIHSFKEFTISPHDHTYYLVLIRSLKDDAFRIALLDPHQCYMSRQEKFVNVRNASYGTVDDKTFRSTLISALSHPQHAEYEIEEVNHEQPQKNARKKRNQPESGSSPKQKHYPKRKELKIIRKASGGLRVIIANINVFLNPTEKRGDNLNYVLVKMCETLRAKQKKNEGLFRDNRSYQEKIIQAHQSLDEAIALKNQQESELLSKFVLILNEKKKKIRALQREIVRLKQGGNVNNNHGHRSSKEENESENDADNDGHVGVVGSLSPIIGDSEHAQSAQKSIKRNPHRSAIVDDDNTMDVVMDVEKEKQSKKRQKEKIERMDTNEIIAAIGLSEENALGLDLSIVELDNEHQSASSNHNRNHKKRKREVMEIADDDDDDGGDSPILVKRRKLSKQSDASDDFHTDSLV